MAFSTDPTWLDGLTYSGLEARLADAMLLQSNGAAAGGVSGVRPGDPGLLVSLVSTTITVAAGVAAVAYPAFGVYRAFSVSSTTPGPLSAADPTNPRIDLVYLRVWDNAVDGAGLSKADTVYLAGTPAVSPVAPTPGGSIVYLPLATIAVPKVGGGPASVTDARPPAVGPGGISPNAAAAGTYAGQYRDSGTATGKLQRYNGTTWQDMFSFAAGGITVPSGNLSITAGGRLIEFATLVTDLIQSAFVNGDSVDRWQLKGGGDQHWGPGSGATDTHLARTGVGALTLTGSLTATAMAPTVAEDTGVRTTTSLTYVALNSFAATVVVPPSGKVRVDYRATFRTSAAIALSTVNASGSASGTNHTGIDTEALTSAATSDVTQTLVRLLTGLTPGETLTVTPVHRVSSAATQTVDYRYLLLTPSL